jgi:hypothetical protein
MCAYTDPPHSGKQEYGLLLRSVDPEGQQQKWTRTSFRLPSLFQLLFPFFFVFLHTPVFWVLGDGRSPFWSRDISTCSLIREPRVTSVKT